MSRIDEALRRASIDITSVHSPVAIDLPAIPVDASALDMYSGERHAPQRRKPDPRPAIQPVKTSAPPTRNAALHVSLEGKAVISRETSPVSIEQYRRLATALHAIQAERGLKTLMISSAVPHDGKTLTVTNLALTLSDSYGRRVLLIDADFRRPCIHELFGLMNVGGLADALRSPDAAINAVAVTPTLSVLPAGQVGASLIAALSSDRMRIVIAEAAKQFDWVLVDTPPVGLLSDAHHVARVTDGVLFVIAAGSTPYPVVQRSIAEIGADRIVGVVLNRVEPHSLAVQDYYGRYYSRRHD